MQAHTNIQLSQEDRATHSQCAYRLPDSVKMLATKLSARWLTPEIHRMAVLGPLCQM